MITTLSQKITLKTLLLASVMCIAAPAAMAGGNPESTANNSFKATESFKINDFTDLKNWQVRLRSISIIPEESSSLNTGLSADIHSQTVPEIDVTFFLTKNIAAELIAATAMHEVEASGVDLGHTKILPPTLTVQYHFAPEEKIRPYVGAGLNYTFFYDKKAANGLGTVTYKDGIGYALQAGVDFMADENWGVNLDVKKLFLNTDVNVASGTHYGNVDVDPWIFGAGITYKF